MIDSPQPDLFGLEPKSVPTSIPYQRHSQTSQEAAARVRPLARSHEEQVFDAILAAGKRGITRKELSEMLPWADRQQNRITGRVSSLMRKKWIRELHTIVYEHNEPHDRTVRRDGSVVLVAGVR